jgi:hypothetical protein
LESNRKVDPTEDQRNREIFLCPQNERNNRWRVGPRSRPNAATVQVTALKCFEKNVQGDDEKNIRSIPKSHAELRRFRKSEPASFDAGSGE